MGLSLVLCGYFKQLAKKESEETGKLFEESAVNAEKARENENTVLAKNADQPEI